MYMLLHMSLVYLNTSDWAELVMVIDDPANNHH